MNDYRQLIEDIRKAKNYLDLVETQIKELNDQQEVEIKDQISSYEDELNKRYIGHNHENEKDCLICNEWKYFNMGKDMIEKGLKDV